MGINPAEILAKHPADMTPWERGFSDRFLGKPGPSHVPHGDASWSEKLFYRGFCDALRYLPADRPTSGDTHGT